MTSRRPPLALSTLRPVLARPGRPLKSALGALQRLRLRWIYLKEDIDGIEAELRLMRLGHADVLRQFGASVDRDCTVVGPISLVNARRSLSNLTIAARSHVGSEVFIDLADRVTIAEGATVSMRAVILTHIDVGRGPLIERRPRETGPVVIEPGAFVGAGAIILHGVTIGRESVIPAGVVVTKDVPPFSVLTRAGRVVPEQGRTGDRS
ncbi:MAG TPA: acyltransferase [Tepidiformaceae bacterium]|nr:acyltransferase [Tepidiformaceae bacterium]